MTFAGDLSIEEMTLDAATEAWLLDGGSLEEWAALKRES